MGCLLKNVLTAWDILVEGSGQFGNNIAKSSARPRKTSDFNDVAFVHLEDCDLEKATRTKVGRIDVIR